MRMICLHTIQPNEQQQTKHRGRYVNQAALYKSRHKNNLQRQNNDTLSPNFLEMLFQKLGILHFKMLLLTYDEFITFK